MFGTNTLTKWAGNLWKKYKFWDLPFFLIFQFFFFSKFSTFVLLNHTDTGLLTYHWCSWYVLVCQETNMPVTKIQNHDAHASHTCSFNVFMMHASVQVPWKWGCFSYRAVTRNSTGEKGNMFHELLESDSWCFQHSYTWNAAIDSYGSIPQFDGSHWLHLGAQTISNSP